MGKEVSLLSREPRGVFWQDCAHVYVNYPIPKSGARKPPVCKISTSLPINSLASSAPVSRRICPTKIWQPLFIHSYFSLMASVIQSALIWWLILSQCCLCLPLADLDRPCNPSSGQCFISAPVHFQVIFKVFLSVLCTQREERHNPVTCALNPSATVFIAVYLRRMKRTALSR